jgi:hypothetical protein
VLPTLLNIFRPDKKRILGPRLPGNVHNFIKMRSDFLKMMSKRLKSVKLPDFECLLEEKVKEQKFLESLVK